MEELKKAKSSIPLETLKKSLDTRETEVRNFKKAISGVKELSLIAEIKKASPSLGTIVDDFDHLKIAQEYQLSLLVDAISIITENDHFQGGLSFIRDIKPLTSVPLFRKDFIVDEYQIYETFLAESDALLLIAAILDVDELKNFLHISRSLGMDCLVETHNEIEVRNAIKAGASIIGINARDLKTFEVSKNLFEELAKIIPKNIITVAESGLETFEDVEKVKQAGADAILVGTSIMKARNKKLQIQKLLGKSD